MQPLGHKHGEGDLRGGHELCFLHESDIRDVSKDERLKAVEDRHAQDKGHTSGEDNKSHTR